MMKCPLRTLALLSSALICGTSGSAQSGIPVAPDTRVRVELLNGVVLKGLVSAVDRDSLYLFADNTASPRAVAHVFIRTLRQSHGRDRWRGARRGALVTGVISLVAIGFSVYTDSHSKDAIVPSTLFVAPLGLVFTGLGSGVGAVAAPEKWTARTDVSNARPWQQAQEVRLGVRWQF
jgi:hypothetical protein